MPRGCDMKRYVMLVTLCLIALFAQMVWADSTTVIKAEPVTGWNRLLGQPRYHWDFAPAPFDLAGAQTIDVYNPDGDHPLPLTPETPDDAVLATTVDPDLELIFPPFTIDQTDPDAINVPIRDIATWITGDLQGRAPLPPISEAPVVSQSQAAPASPTPITKADWLKGSGRMLIRCRKDGTAHLRIDVRDLIANRVYTVWAMWLTSDLRVFPQPMGGAPNAYVTDADGDARFERELDFCPTDVGTTGLSGDGNILLSVITHLHSDHVLYGAIPTPLFGGLPPGTVLHMQLEWNLPGVGTRLID